MAINKNHEFEELGGIKCAIVEKNVSAERVEFLRALLSFNNYTVVVQPSAPPKTAAPVAVESAAEPVKALPLAPETYTVGVSDVMFNAVNAIFGRLLKTENGHVVTLAYWKQKDAIANDDIPYFENTF